MVEGLPPGVWPAFSERQVLAAWESSSAVNIKRFATKVFGAFLFTPGFSQVIRVAARFGNRLKRFTLKTLLLGTWLKPGVNETNSR